MGSSGNVCVRYPSTTRLALDQGSSESVYKFGMRTRSVRSARVELANYGVANRG